MTAIETMRQDHGALIRELEAAGATIRGKAISCPFHEDRHPSASIYRDDEGVWRFKCHAVECGFVGDIFDVRAQATGRQLEEVLREANPDTRDGSRPRPQEHVYATIEDLRLAVSRAGDIEAEYGYVNPDTGRTDLLVFRVTTPGGKAFRQAHPVNGGWVQKGPPKPWPLYNRARIRAADSVVVVEGEKCVHALHDIGITATTAPAGAGKGGYADWRPLAGKRVVLWPDNDVAGRSHMTQVAALLERPGPVPRVSVIEPADLDLGDKEDVFDFIEQCRAVGMDPRQAVLDALSKARPCTVAGKLKVRLDDSIAGRRRPVAFPWPKLTELSRALVQNTVTLLCGSPGATKSFLLLECLAHWHEQGIKTACYCLEEGLDYHLNRVLAQREGNSDLTREEWQEEHPDETRAAYKRHEAFLDDFGRWLWAAPDTTPTKADLARWVEARAKEGCRVVAVDPLSAAEETRDVWVVDSQFVNEVKRIVRQYPVSVLLVMHPKKGHGKGPGTLDDLAGGAAYQRLAQTALWLEYHKPPVTKRVAQGPGRGDMEFNRTLHILKARNAEGTYLGLAFGFNAKTLRTSEHGVILHKDDS